MERHSSPAVGFNNNVRHRDRIFHIQTEDSGVLRPHVSTHLFVDGGRIIKSMRTDYSAELGSADLPGVVRRLMKMQHKAMFLALRDGTLDSVIETLGSEASSESPEPLPASIPNSLALPASTSVPAASEPMPVAYARKLTPVPPPPLPSFDRHIPTPVPPPLRAPTPAPPITTRGRPVMPPPMPLSADAARAHSGSPYLYIAAIPDEGAPRARTGAAEPPPQRPPKTSGARRLGRPTALADVTPNAQSIFGVAPSVREQSLDNAIQSYLERASDDPLAK